MTEQYGYAGKILRVDLSSQSISHIPTEAYSDKYLGGRGIAARIYWEEVPPEVKALDPENRLLIFNGPLAGFNGIGSPRWTVCGKSPLTVPEHFSYCNLGGSWGVHLKFAGYDGMVIQGKSDKPVYIYINDDTVEIRDASDLWGKTTIEVRDILKKQLGKSMSVLDCGPAGENRVAFASLLADNDASGSCGFGAVMGSKNLKAIAVRGSKRPTAANRQRLKELTSLVRELKKDSIGSGQQNLIVGNQVKKDVCYGCIGACIRQTFQAKDGTKGKYACGSAWFYQERALRYYGEWNEVPFFATRLCDGYGLDTESIHTLIMWLNRCNKAGILTDENTGIPFSQMGSYEFIETLVKKISFRDGFGDVLAQGLVCAAETVGKGSKELITDYTSKAGYGSEYCPRMYIVSGLLYAMEPRLPIQQVHEVGVTLFAWLDWAKNAEGSYLSTDIFRNIAKRFWGSELAADFSTYDGKALAAMKIQDREYAKESLILCDWMWPIVHVNYSADHVGDPTLESKLLSTVTGNLIDEEGLYRTGERIFNLQRAILVREGHKGRASDILPEPFYTRPLKSSVQDTECLAPGKDGEVISRKGTVVDRDKFEQMKDEYYQLRGWDMTTGLQKYAKLNELGLKDVADDLKSRGLIATRR
jgi:aldehyde:ferredoxin oxidoreductase